MATTTIPWGDGSGDNIYLTYTSASGNQTVQVSSDPNDGPARTKDITFVSTVGNIARVLTVIQETNMDYVSITWNDTCITFNDTGIAYPYEEEYIVFADPVVEQICATNWGDGVGIKPSQAAQVTSFGNVFISNTDITSFDEQSYFTGLTSYGSYNPGTFSGCTSLVSVTIPEIPLNSGVQTYERAYQNCTALETVTLHGVLSNLAGTSGPSYTFNNCSSLTRVNIDSIEKWMSNYFAGNGATPFYASGGGRLYINNVEVTNLVIPSTETRIKLKAFYGCIGITSLTIPSSITEIGANAFTKCIGLTGPLDIPSSVITIGQGAFGDCTGFTGRLTIPSSVTTLGASAFNNFGAAGEGVDLYYNSSFTPNSNSFFNRAKIRLLIMDEGPTYINASLFRAWVNDAKVLAYVDLPSTITELKDAAFYGQPLTTFIIRATTPPTLANTAAVNYGAFTNVYVPYSADHSVLASYQSANIWSNYASKIHELNPDGTIPT